MKVSVVVPAHNEERYIRKCLRSLLAQEEKADEIIVVDNNSTDKTAAIAEKMGIKVLKEKRQGIIFARNTGFDACQGDIIARTDADTVVPRKWIKIIKKDFEDHNIAALSGPAKFGIESLLPLVKLIFFQTNKVILGHHTLYGPNMALKKSMWEKVKSETCRNDKLVHEDIDLGIHIARYGHIWFDPNLIVKTSARRIKDPKTFFIKYNIKWVKSIQRHKFLLERLRVI